MGAGRGAVLGNAGAGITLGIVVGDVPGVGAVPGVGEGSTLGPRVGAGSTRGAFGILPGSGKVLGGLVFGRESGIEFGAFGELSGIFGVTGLVGGFEGTTGFGGAIGLTFGAGSFAGGFG